ncbi:MAG: aldo/keto reductase [Cyclobacteriaceae bacterium]|nr:aldo/keto reductase [Cyclobacteriaceae bacterium]
MKENKNTSLIYGCMGLGGEWNDSPIRKEDIDHADKALSTAIDCGITSFDHADIYTDGKAETVFGLFLKNNPGIREKIKIQSKAGILLRADPSGSSIFNNSKGYITKQVEIILQRLQIDCLDSLLIHRPDPLTTNEDLAETLTFLINQGYTKKIGVSNMEMSKINALQKHLSVPIFANQIQFGLGHSHLVSNTVLFNTNRITDHSLSGLYEYAQNNDFEIQAWGAFDRGLYLNNASTDESVIKTSKLLVELAKKYDTAPITIQLAWLQFLPITLRPIIGTTNPERIKQCTDSSFVELSREDWYSLWISALGSNLP